MEKLDTSKDKFPTQEIRYAAPVEELLFGTGKFGHTGIYRDILVCIAFFTAFGLFIALRNGFIYAPLGFSLIFLIIGSFGIPALCQPLPKIKWNAKSITFPLLCWSELGLRTTRSWKDVSKIKFLSGLGQKYEPVEIQVILKEEPDLFPRNEKSFYLKLDAFRKSDLEKFIHSIRVFAPHVTFSPELDRLDIGINPNKSVPVEKSAPTHTSLWMAELNRIAPTVFVPLDTGDTLQDNMIEVIGQVATGGLSAIYLVKSKVYNISILKESVLPDSGEDEAHTKIIEMFKREANILSTLNHQRIVKVHDYFVENDRHYLLMEFIDGSNLRKVIGERGAQSEEIVLRWAIEMANILEYLHSQTPPVVHRDFTPDNIILENDGSITLIDFGAANHCLTTVTGTIVGKTSYMPIEQFQGKPNPSSDVYSLAKTIHYLLTGLDPEPFITSKLLEVGCPVSRQLNDLITKCTSSAEERPDIKQVKAELETIQMIVKQNG